MSMFSTNDYVWMAHALRLAKKGLYTTDPNPRVGCVLIKNDKLISEGWHEQCGRDHAEIKALKQAGNDAPGCTAYVTLEPCCHYGKTPPCTDALIAAGIVRVVTATLDPNPKVSGKGLQQLEQAGISTCYGLMEAQTKQLNLGFFSRMDRQRPYVRTKIAMTLDGQTALKNGQSRWITGPQARQDVHRLRARHSAILTGIGTVLADNPRMTVRLTEETPVKAPVRIVMDSRLRMPVEADFLNAEAESWVFMAAKTDKKMKQAGNMGGDKVFSCPNEQGQVDLTKMLTILSENGINEVLIEAGSALNGAFLSAGLIDEVIVYMAPKLFGEQGRSPWGNLGKNGGLQQVTNAYNLTLQDVRQIGEDSRFIFKPNVYKPT